MSIAISPEPFHQDSLEIKEDFKEFRFPIDLFFLVHEKPLRPDNFRMLEGLNRVQHRIGDIIQKFDPPRVKTADEKPEPSAVPLRNTSAYNGPGFGRELESLIQQESSRHQVSPDLVRAMVRVESGGKPNAVSSAGAIGLMQLMPDTARQLGVDPYDPQENLDGGIRFLKNLANRYGNLDQTLAAYNAGPAAVDRYHGIPPYRETQNYVRQIRNLLGQ